MPSLWPSPVCAQDNAKGLGWGKMITREVRLCVCSALSVTPGSQLFLPIPHSLTPGTLVVLTESSWCWEAWCSAEWFFRRCQRPLRTNWVLRRPGLSSWPQEVLPVGVTLDELFTLSILQFSSLAKGVPSGWVNMRKLLGAMSPTW